MPHSGHFPTLGPWFRRRLGSIAAARPRRVGLGTFLLLILIAALSAAMIAQESRWIEREAREADQLARLSRSYRELAEAHRSLARFGQGTPGRFDSQGYIHGSRPTAKSRFHRELAQKYANAAMTPWLPIKPDPPEPED